MNIRIATRIEDIGISAGQWNALAAGSETNTVFQTRQWYESWWEVFGGQNGLFLVSVSGDRGGLLGIAPLMISRRNGTRTLRFIGDDKSDYCDFIAGENKAAVIECIIEELLRHGGEWDSVCLKNIPEGSSTVAVLSRLCRGKALRMITSHVPCPTLMIKGREEEADRILKKKTIRRRYNYFKKNGELVFRHITSEKETLRSLEVFFGQHMKRMALNGGSSLFRDARNREFYVRLTKGFMGEGWLLFSVLEFNGAPIAFHFGFDYGTKVIWYKPSFDIDYFRHSPGQVMLMHLIRYSLENGRSEFDFTLGDEPFKRQFTNRIRKNTQVKLYKSGPTYLFELSKHYIRKAVRTTKTLTGQ